MRIVFRALFLMVAVVLSACANLDTVAKASAEEGKVKAYTEDYELVKAAVLASVQNLNVNIKQTEQTAQGFDILFTKSISAFSWGEVGRVLVAKNGTGGANVYVRSEKRSRMQITGTDEVEFANAIFSGASEILRGSKK